MLLFVFAGAAHLGGGRRLGGRGGADARPVSRRRSPRMPAASGPCAFTSGPTPTCMPRWARGSGSSRVTRSSPARRPGAVRSRSSSARTTARRARRCSSATSRRARRRGTTTSTTRSAGCGAARAASMSATRLDPLEDGAAFRITPREVHIVENTRRGPRACGPRRLHARPGARPRPIYARHRRLVRDRDLVSPGAADRDRSAAGGVGEAVGASSRSSSTRPTSTRARRARSRIASAPPTRSTSRGGTRTAPSGSSGSSGPRRPGRGSPRSCTAIRTRSPSRRRSRRG